MSGDTLHHIIRWNVKKSKEVPEQGLAATKGCVNW
jgi:hypothetical protein